MKTGKRQRRGHFLVEVLDLGQGWPQSRGEEVSRLSQALLDAGYDISEREIEGWTTEQRQLAAVFSDAIMMGEGMTRPEFIPDRMADWAKARNPETPTDELVRLASSAVTAKHLAANPRLEELLSLPEFLKRARVDQLIEALMSRSDAIPQRLFDIALSGEHLSSKPIEVLTRLASYEKLELSDRQRALSSLPLRTAAEAIEDLEIEGELEPLGAILRRALRRWRNIGDVTPLDIEEVDALVELDGIGALVVARLMEAPRAMLTKLAEHEDVLVRAGVAANPSTPTSALEALAEEPWLEVQKAIVGNLAAPLSLIRQIALKVPPKLRGQWARSRDTNPMILDVLARDQVVKIRVWLAKNESTPSKTRSLLSEDRSSKVRAALAQNELIHQTLLEQLVMDTSPKVLKALRKNGATPRYLREKALRALATIENEGDDARSA